MISDQASTMARRSSADFLVERVSFASIFLSMAASQVNVMKFDCGTHADLFEMRFQPEFGGMPAQVAQP